MSWYKLLDGLDAKLMGLQSQSESMFGKLIESLKWSWNTMTLICIVMIALFILYLWAFIYPIWRRKRKQRRWRAYLKKEAEERVSNK